MSRPRLDLFVVGFGRPDLLREQLRLLERYLLDPYTLTVVDNTLPPGDHEMQVACNDLGLRYVRVESEKHEHPDALEVAARRAKGAYWGTLDHDVFPTAETSVIAKIKVAGFYGLGQTYTPRVGEPLRYLWPGWCFFSRRWLAGRTPNFRGIRGKFAFDDGDAGSEMHALFDDADWQRFPDGTHGYETIRPEDGHGLQSFGVERFDEVWLHLTNASRWKDIPDPDGRDALLRDMIAAL